MIAWTQVGWGLAIVLAVLATVAEARTKRIPNGLRSRHAEAPSIEDSTVELYATPYILVVTIASVVGRGVLIATMWN